MKCFCNNPNHDYLEKTSEEYIKENRKDYCCICKAFIEETDERYLEKGNFCADCNSRAEKRLALRRKISTTAYALTTEKSIEKRNYLIGDIKQCYADIEDLYYDNIKNKNK